MIKNIIFDFGGVLLDINYQKTINAFDKLYGPAISAHSYQEILDLYEVGAFSEGSFLYQLQAISPKVISEREIVDAFNAMLGPLPQHRLDMLLMLSNDFRIFLLSNTNHTHIHYVYRYLAREYGISDFAKEYFDGVVFSHRVHLSKPGTEIYNNLADTYHLDKRQCLFIDDLIQNVEGARLAGLLAQHHDRATEITDLISDYIKAHS